MGLTIYGSPRSRTMRVLWTANKLGLQYEHVPLAFDDPALETPEFLRINPAAAVPVVLDDGFALSESLAINLYLAKKYGRAGSEALYPATLEGEAAVWRWSLWAQAHLEPWVQRDALLEGLRTVIGDHARPNIEAALATLDSELSQRPWLVGDHFTVGDLNVAAVLSPSRAAHIDFGAYGHVRNWLSRCYARPAAVATRRRYQG